MTDAGHLPSKSLKLLLEPDDYLCTWLFPDGETNTVRVPGALTLGRANSVPHGTAYGNGVPITPNASATTVMAFAFPQHVEYPVLRAEMANGYSVTLLDVTVEMWVPERASIYAAAVMVGLYDTTDEGHVTGLRVQVTGLDAASGLAPLAPQTVPLRHAPGVTYEVQRSGAELAWSDDAATLTLSYQASAHLGDPFEYGFTFSPILELSLLTPVPLQNAIRTYVDPLQHALQLASGRRESLTYLEALGKTTETGDNARWQVFGSQIDQRPYDSNHERIRKTKTALWLASDGASLLEAIRAWNTHDGEGHPLIETFAKDLPWLRDQPPRAQVLTLCQAIEGAYDHTHAAELQQLQDAYTTKRDDALDAVKDAGVTGKNWQFVKGSIPKRAPSNLSTPLRWTAEAAPGGLPALAAATPLIAAKTPTEPGSDWADGVRVIRNELSHGRSIPRPELLPVAKLLTRHLRIHTLTLLGANPLVADRIHAAD